MRKWGAALVLVAIAGVLVFLWHLSAPTTSELSSPSVAVIQTNGPAKVGLPHIPELSSGRMNPDSAPRVSYSSAVEMQKEFMRAKILSAPPASMPELTNVPPTAVMENMRSVFRQYAERFGGNPVGTNPEITAALNGGNPKQVQFLASEEGLRINENGELVDSWGTPFFFHQLSAREMEIHSAGPDRVMWTGDDLVIK